MDESLVVAAITRARKGIAQYLEIMNLRLLVDVSHDREFQRKYNAFYRVRQRPREWYEQYYAYMERSKANPPTFPSTLDHIFAVLGRYEPSFSSNLVATLDPNRPVWDAFVLRNTNQTPPSYTAKNRVEMAKVVYRGVQRWYEAYLPTGAARRVIELFDREVEDHERVTDLKKIDFVLWQMRG